MTHTDLATITLVYTIFEDAVLHLIYTNFGQLIYNM